MMHNCSAVIDIIAVSVPDTFEANSTSGVDKSSGVLELLTEAAGLPIGNVTEEEVAS